MRHARDRAKLATGVGILTMLLGAMFVLAPAAGAQEEEEHKVTICHRTNSVTNPYVIITVDYDGANGDLVRGPDHYEHPGDVFDFTADPAVAYPTPRNGDQWGDIIPPVPIDDEPGMSEGLNWEDGEAIWRDNCGQPDEDLTTLTIVKSVTGANAPTDWSFPFTGLAGGFNLTDEDSSTDAEVIDADTAYTITETNTGGASSTTFNCVGASSWEPGEGSAADIEVTVAEGGDATCTFTNNYPTSFIPGCVDNPLTEEDECNPEIPTPDTASLTVVKAVAGEDAPADWSFPFTVTDLGAVDLTDDDPDFQELELVAGTYTITESDAGDADLTDISCSVGTDVTDSDISDDGSSGSVTVALDEGDAVTCTFTNTFPDVEGTDVVNPPTPEPAAEEPAVLGEQVVRTLPRTGSTNGPLAVLGVALLLVGATLVGGSRLRLRYLD